MSHEVKIHHVQTAVLRELLFRPDSSFSELQKIVGLDSDHFKFHTNRLVEMGYVAKNEAHRYHLTPTGKEYANRLDTDQNTLERQPKSTVIVVLQNDEGAVLV